MSSISLDLVLNGGTVVTMDGRRQVLSPGWVSVAEGKIVQVGEGEPPLAARTVDHSGDLILPGFVNTHAHTLGCFTRGMGGDRFSALSPSALPPTSAIRLEMGEEEAYAAARLALLEMQLSGVTTTTDSLTSLRGREHQIDGVLRAFAESGMNAVFYRASVDRTDIFPAQTHDSVDLAATELDRLRTVWEGPRLGIGLEPLAMHRVTTNLLQGLIELAADRQVPLALHGPYSKTAAQHSFGRWGRSVVKVMADLGGLSPSLLMHHPVVVDAEDIALLAEHGVAVSVCAVGNMLIGVGPAPLPTLLSAGVRTSLGLDQPNDGHDMFQLMKMTILAQRGSKGDIWGSPGEMIELATQGGAEALGTQAGSLAPGKWADVVVMDGSHPTLHPRPAALSNLVLASGPQAIRSVYVQGKQAVEAGRHLIWDTDEVTEAVDASFNRCLRRSGLASGRPDTHG
ncbi:MAG: amidohydrolase family protein [bacterium]|nr:amidohydrolase family protein [Acidimicrobiia bacterium]MCY4651303.1 amidohydrolase family protein [bacterium]